MTVEIRSGEAVDPESWNRHVERSPQTNPFHRWEALGVMATHADADMHPLVGVVGEEPVGVFPVFVVTKGPFDAAFSPPPPLWVPNLGPGTLNMGKLSRRKAERRLVQFIDGCVEWIEANVDPSLIRISTDRRFGDVRPFTWNDFTVAPVHTYVVDLTPGRDELLERFSGDARQNIDDASDADVAVEEGTADDVRWIIEQVRNRYDAQSTAFRMPTGFVEDLYSALPAGYVRPYVCRRDGELLGGIVVLEDEDTAYRWHGGVKPDEELDVAVNDLLDWRVMTDAKERGVGWYDLVGADDRRLNRYKAKFGPDLQPYYAAERGSWVARGLSRVYERLSTKGVIP